MNIPFKHLGLLNGPAYYQTCPVRHKNEQNRDLTYTFHSYSTNKTPEEQLMNTRSLSSHTLSFVMKGEVHITWDEWRDVTIKAGEMYFLPRGAEISGYIVGKVEVVVAKFARGMTGKELDDLRKMKDHEMFQNFEFKPMEMRPQMLKLMESIKDYLTMGVNCAHLHEAKACELYVVLHWFYSQADNAQLFYPMAGALSEFKKFILDNFKVTTSLDTLMKKSNMSRSTFDRKFKETFHTTPGKWIDELTRQMIISKASEPYVTVKDIMYEVGVYNASQFTTLCKRLCGVTPSQLIRP